MLTSSDTVAKDTNTQQLDLFLLRQDPTRRAASRSCGNRLATSLAVYRGQAREVKRREQK